MKPVIYVHAGTISIGLWESKDYIIVNLCHLWNQKYLFQVPYKQLPLRARLASDLSAG